MLKPYYEEKGISIYVGDCREILPSLSNIDSVITDPPYGLSFMGKEWDHGVPGIEFWDLVSKACKPGAMLLAFGGTRTFHKLTVAIEDAGPQNSGGASRFFYCAKASSDDRGNKEELEMPLFNTVDPGIKNGHPTVKPLDLMEKLLHLTTYLCKLTSTPPGGIVLDPFMGSGTTLVASKRAGRKAIGIEINEEYAEIAVKRLK